MSGNAWSGITIKKATIEGRTGGWYYAGRSLLELFGFQRGADHDERILTLRCD
jgi:hypothetical protein